MSEKFYQFEKFMSDLQERQQTEIERQKQLQKEEELWSNRELQRRYWEHPHNHMTTHDKK